MRVKGPRRREKGMLTKRHPSIDRDQNEPKWQIHSNRNSFWQHGSERTSLNGTRINQGSQLVGESDHDDQYLVYMNESRHGNRAASRIALADPLATEARLRRHEGTAAQETGVETIARKVAQAGNQPGVKAGRAAGWEE